MTIVPIFAALALSVVGFFLAVGLGRQIVEKDPNAITGFVITVGVNVFALIIWTMLVLAP